MTNNLDRALTVLLGEERKQIVFELSRLLDEAEARGKDVGHNEGFEQALAHHKESVVKLHSGYDAGYADGYADCEDAGYTDGYADGKWEMGGYAGARTVVTEATHVEDDEFYAALAAQHALSSGSLD